MLRRVVPPLFVVAALTGALLPAGAAEPTTAEVPRPRAVEVGRGPSVHLPEDARTSLRLRSGSVDTRTPAAADKLRTLGPGPLVLQFEGPIRRSDLARLRESGAELLAILPDHAVRVRTDRPDRLAGIERIRWADRLRPEQVIHPQLDGTQLVRIVLDPGSDVEAAAATVASAGSTVVRSYDSGLIAMADRAASIEIARAVPAQWIEPWSLPEPHNEYGAAIVGADIANDLGYDGSTQIVAVADTGLGAGTASNAHRDIPADRVAGIADYPGSSGFSCWNAFPDGPIDVDTGHGTHVAGSVLSGGGPAGEGRGAAPGASLYFQAVEDYVDYILLCAGLQDGYQLIGLPADLGDLLQDAYDQGARIHQDSWGASAAGEYTADSAAVDSFMWQHQDMLMVVSAGNDGRDGDGDGVVDDGSIGSPATAKNVLSIGASENARSDLYPCDAALTYTTCGLDGGINTLNTYGSSWPADFPAAPLFGDPSAGGAQQLAAFSSRGPTQDGRIKPDVVAPGTWVLSGYSDLYQEQYDPAPNPRNGAYQSDGWGFPYDEHYKYFGGTSMAAPIASGAAAIVRDYYTKAHGLSWISGALVKATLINSATDIADENNDGVDDNALPIPNMHEGWGRVDVAAATDESHTWFDDGSVATGTQVTYATALETGTVPLKVTLVWSDYQGTGSCGSCLVNDLDLIVTAPDGEQTYVGNNFSGGWTPEGAAATDQVNNVENVYIEVPEAGVWTITVTGSDVPVGPQPFALVIDADFDESIDLVAPTWTNPTLEAAGITKTSATLIWSGASDDVGVVAYDVYSDASLLETTTSTSAALAGLTPDTAYSISVQARDAAGNVSSGGPSLTFTTIEDDPPDWSGVLLSRSDVGETHLTLSWDAPVDASGIETYLVYQDETLIGQPGGLQLAVTGLRPATAYSFVVEARDVHGATSTDGPALSVTTARDFADTNGHTFEADIAWLSGTGITQGCDEAGNFCPDDSMTRAQMASLLARALGLPIPAGNRFGDVSGVHTGNINAIAEAGITIGCSTDGTRFCPNDPVNRAQMATFIDRAFVLLGATTDYFSDDQGSVHETAINRVAETGITLGCRPGLFCPYDNVTRGQISAFLHRTFVNLGLE